jgi:c-di-GMP-binding flagellar brake protein YcgR
MENCVTGNEEKRGNPRVQKLFMIAYLPKGDGPLRTPVSLGRTIDISPSGVGMEVYKEVAVGTVMEMEIDLDDLPVSAWGKVVRVDLLGNGNYRIGIRFDEQQELLQKKIALAEISSLRQRRDELEKVLLILVDTGWPWGKDGKPRFYATARMALPRQ